MKNNGSFKDIFIDSVSLANVKGKSKTELLCADFSKLFLLSALYLEIS